VALDLGLRKQELTPISGPPDFWTLVLLTPESGFRRKASYMKLQKCDMLEIMLKYVGKALRHLLRNWERLVEHFDGFLENGKPFLDPKKHDNLLVDDETFSRSRKYFWALGCLSEFTLYITNTIHQWEASREVWDARFAGFQSEKSKKYIKKNDELCVKLKVVHDRLQHHHNNITALRDGLFNASAVMESRASTRLGGQAYLPSREFQCTNILQRM
jgi:hypothetical protein